MLIPNLGSVGEPLHVTDKALSVTRIAGGPNIVTLYDRDGLHPLRLPLPEVSAVREIDTTPSGDFLYTVSTFLEPTYFERWSGSANRARPTPPRQTSPVSYADAEVTRIFATSKDGTQFDALFAYSPLHHVVPGTKYPAVLLLTSANDGRVNPLHSRKFAAALQAAQSDPAHPILLRTSKTSGHGIGSSIDEIIFTQTDQLMFLLDQLGMDTAAAAR